MRKLDELLTSSKNPRTHQPLRVHLFAHCSNAVTASKLPDNVADRRMCKTMLSAPVLKDHDGGDAADTVLGGNAWALVGVQLHLNVTQHSVQSAQPHPPRDAEEPPPFEGT